MKTERRFIAGPVPARIEERAGKTPMIAGLASVYYDGTDATQFQLWQDGSDVCVERILPGAFDDALSRPDDVRALVNHDPAMLLGRMSAGTLRLASTSAGLAYEIDPPGTQAARDCMESIQRGDMTGSSFAFVVDAQNFAYQKREGGTLYVREIRSVTLQDVGPVTYPAYEGATAGVRAAGEIIEARAAFDAWLAADRCTLAGRLASIRARAVEVAEG